MTKRVALVVGTTSGGTGTHVRMLAAGFASRGIGVSVFGPMSADAQFGFSALPRVAFVPVEIGDLPRPGDVAAIVRLRRALRRAEADGTGEPASRTGRPGGAANGAGGTGEAANGARGTGDEVSGADGNRPFDVVHAHGLRAGALTVLSLAGVRGERRPGLVVTVHNAPPGSGGAAAVAYRVLERIVARGAGLLLCVSADLERRMRAAGARRVERAVVPAPDSPLSPSALSPSPLSPSALSPSALSPSALSPSAASPAALPVLPLPAAPGRPVVLAVGRLVAQKGFGALLEAAVDWRDLEPPPLVVIAGDGPLAGELRARAAALGVAAAFLGQRDDVPALLRSATVFVLASRWEGQPLVLQEALRAGAAIVATRTGGIPELTGEDAALLVPPQDAARLAAAVRAVLTDRLLAGRLRAEAAERAARLPSEADAVTAVLAAYASLGAECWK